MDHLFSSVFISLRDGKLATAFAHPDTNDWLARDLRNGSRVFRVQSTSYGEPQFTEVKLSQVGTPIGHLEEYEIVCGADKLGTTEILRRVPAPEAPVSERHLKAVT